ncbi:hypothetical protein HMN09_00917500 [Mycena chlorophos]|uniref:F-box domain-containing protein n=1 Tax=Mycena chlorophos TaxID=658473 RepID=A0A8H6SL80_MYCCL|nr:hypothetical protein HMN09_00917500 [Mycena chlorophos]
MSNAFLAPVSAASTVISGVAVPYDVLSLILAALPDFDSLHAAMSVCSTWRAVFVASQRSVLTRVARNVVGSALRQAVRFVRFPYPEKTPNDWPGDDEGEEGEESVTEPDSDDDEQEPKPIRKGKPRPTYAEDEPIGLLTPEERVKLQRSAQVVRKLEALFIVKAAQSASLTRAQSHRFTRAVYRVMLFCELFYLPLNLDDIDSMEDNEPGVLTRMRADRAAHLRDSRYTTPELFEMRSVIDFLYDLIRDSLSTADEFDRLKDVCLATGPAVILAAYEGKSEQPYEDALEPDVLTTGEDNEFFAGFLVDAIGAVVKERRETLPIAQYGAILDGDETDMNAAMTSLPSKCSRCDASHDLYHKSNWSTLIPIDFIAHLPGVLSSNDVEAAALLDIFMTGTTLSTRLDAGTLIEQLFDDVSLRATGAAKEFDGWKKEEMLCEGCLGRFVGGCLVGWAWKRKVSDGWTPTQNCWYGWNCTTQVHKADHAKTKNHLCAPIR